TASRVLQKQGKDPLISFRVWGRSAQDGVVLSEYMIRLGAGLVASIARCSGLQGGFILERILVAEREVAPLRWFVFETLRILNRCFQSGEVAHEVPFSAARLLSADEDKLLDDDGPIAKLPGLFEMVEAFGINVDVMKLGKCGFATVEVVGR